MERQDPHLSATVNDPVTRWRSSVNGPLVQPNSPIYDQHDMMNLTLI